MIARRHTAWVRNEKKKGTFSRKKGKLVCISQALRRVHVGTCYTIVTT